MKWMRKRHPMTVFLLVFMLCFQLISPAINRPVIAAQTEDAYLIVTKESITIDGVTITKAEFLEALPDAKRLPDDWQQRAPRSMVELGVIYDYDGDSAPALASIGIGVNSVFQKVIYAMTLVDISGTVWLLTVNGVSLVIICTTAGMIINNVSVGFSWPTYELSQYFAAHMEDSNYEFDESDTEGEGEGDTDPGNDDDDDDKDKDKDPEVDRSAEIEAIINNNISQENKAPYRCDQFATELTQELTSAGITHEIIKVVSEDGVYSDKANDIIGVGYHYGIKIGNMIYDNMTTAGMNFDAWCRDLGIGEVAGISYLPVDEITPY